MTFLTFRNPGNFSRRELARKCGITFTEPTLTQQHHKEECDINTIVRRFGVTGVLEGRTRMPLGPEFADVFDFQSAMNTLKQAKDSFMELPAIVRRRFDNDPQELLEFLSDPKNQEEAIRLGLAEKPAEPIVEKPLKVEVVPPIVASDTPKA